MDGQTAVIVLERSLGHLGTGCLVIISFLLDDFLNVVLHLLHLVNLLKDSLLEFPLETSLLNLVGVGEIEELGQFVVGDKAFHDLCHDLVALVETSLSLEDLFEQLIFG